VTPGFAQPRRRRGALNSYSGGAARYAITARPPRLRDRADPSTSPAPAIGASAGAGPCIQQFRQVRAGACCARSVTSELPTTPPWFGGLGWAQGCCGSAR
jgi:hypothetical protein